MTRHILVTGAHGFVGSHLTSHLIARGHRVTALVSPWGRLDRLQMLREEPQLDVIRGDITDPASLPAAFAGVDAVIHAAARVGDWGRYAPFERTNVEGTRNLLAASEAAGAERFVLVSTVAVHRFSGFRDAEAAVAPRDNLRLSYARSKIAAEDLVREWPGGGVVVRPGLWPFGPRDPQLRRVAAALVQGRLPIVGSGETVLNTAYVENLAHGLELAATVPDAAGGTYLVADAGAPTWNELFSELASLLGVRPPRFRLPPSLATLMATTMERTWSLLAPDSEPPLTRYRATLMPRDVHFSIRAAREELGFEPYYSWQEGLTRSVDSDPVLRGWRTV